MLSHHPNDHSFKALSRDEMNLVEFPISVLSKRSDPRVKTLEFTDFISSKNGDHIERKWIITGADKFGLPTSSDDEVLLGLLKLSVDKGFSGRKIHFTRYELLRILKWSTEGRSYTRLQKALDRLSGVRIKTVNGFFDNESKRHTTKNFGLIDEYEINSYSGGDLPNSFFVWSDIMFRSFQVGFIKRLDLDFYLDLKTAVAKRLFRYLDKHFWYKSSVRKNLFALCHEKIGVSRNFKYSSSLLQQIEPGVEELIKRGFLKKFETFGRGKQSEVVFYSTREICLANEEVGSLVTTSNNRLTSHQKKQGSILSKTDSKKHDVDKVVAEISQPLGSTPEVFFVNLGDDLVARGLRRSQVPKILFGRSENDLQKVSQVIKYFDFLCTQKSPLVSRSPIGFLYRAVESIDTFVIPDYFLSRLQVSTTSQQIGTNVNSNEQEQKPPKQEVLSQSEQIDVDPIELENVRAQVERAMMKMKGIISKERYEEVVAHGVQRKLAGLKKS